MGKTLFARHLRAVCLLCLMLAFGGAPPKACALSLNLDSISAMGRFPRFLVNTYRWGDQFFNGYDTTYVGSTGYKFNVKLRTDSWLDYSMFRFADNKYEMDLRSYPSTSAGLWLTYMAVSVGYDINVSKLLHLTHSKRSRFNFQFNCMLFAADLYLQSYDAQMKINRFGPRGDTRRTDIAFDRMHSDSWGLETYYFFNHKHYSQSAAFHYGRIQRRSSGSLFGGFSISGQNVRFDFSGLPADMLAQIPHSWPHYTYTVNAHNYALKLGYAYNKVFSRRCILGVSEAPSFGIRHGWINNESKGNKNTFYAYNRLKISFVYNYRHWFAGIVGEAVTDLFSNNDHTLITNSLSAEVSVGYRFNLW